MRSLFWSTLAASCLVLVACGGGDGGLGPGSGQQLRVDPESLTIAQKKSQQLAVSVVDAEGTLLSGVPVTFASADTTVVTVSATGLITSVGPAGRVLVTVKAPKVTKAVPVTVQSTSGSIVVSPNPAAVPQKGTLQLQAKLVDVVGTPIPGAPLTFTSSNTAVATVSATGLVTSVGPAGQATIFVTSDTFSTQTVVAVTQVATSIAVAPDPIMLATGTAIQVTAKVLDAMQAEMAGQPLIYSATPSSIVTVTPGGRVSAGGMEGTGTLTVQSGTLRRDVSVKVVAGTHPGGTIAATTTANGIPYGAAVSRGGRVYVVGLSGMLHVGTLPAFALTGQSLGGQMTAVAFNSSGSRAWLSGAPAGGLTEFDVATDAPLGQVRDLQGTPFEVALSRDDRQVYVGTGDGKLYVIDAATRSVVTSFDLGTGVVHVAVHPTAPLIYASANTAAAVTEINLETRQTRTFRTGTETQAVAVSADGTEIYVADETVGLDVITLATGAVTPVNLGCGGYGLGLTPDGAQLYVSCSRQGVVKIVNRQSRTVTATLNTGGMPRRVAVSPDGATVVIPNEGGWVDFIK